MVESTAELINNVNRMCRLCEKLYLSGSFKKTGINAG
jgi:hypothetical protein